MIRRMEWKINCHLPIPVLMERNLYQQTADQEENSQSTYQINVVEVAPTTTGSDHLRDPTQALTRCCTRGDSRKGLLDILFCFYILADTPAHLTTWSLPEG